MKIYSFIVLSMLLNGCAEKPTQIVGLENLPMPRFSVLLPDSVNYFQTGNIKANGPFVVFLFGPNCPYSRLQMDDIISDIDKYKETQFYLLTNFSIAQMKPFYEQYELSKYKSFTVGVDTGSRLTQALQITGVPFIAVFDKQKKLKQAYSGFVPGKFLRESL